MFAEYGLRKFGDLYENWPKDDAGEAIPPKFLTHCSSVDAEDTILISFLKSYGIPAVILHPGDGAFGKVVLGLSGTGSSIYVPATMYDQAKELMEAEPDDDLQS
jgi:hypothetical protein